MSYEFYFDRPTEELIDTPDTLISPSQQLIDEIVYLTYKEASTLHKILTTDECIEIATKIILTNYPKCLAKYLNDEPWAF